MQELTDIFAPKTRQAVALGVLQEGGGAAVNGQGYAKTPRVGGARAADGFTAITMRVNGAGSGRAAIAFGGYYAPQTTPEV